MNLRRILTYAALFVSLVLLIKIFYDRTRPVPPPTQDQSDQPEELVVRKYPKGYSLGEFDGRFGISRERFLQIADEAKEVWEHAAGRDLFEYRPDAVMKLNLIFDWRQEQLLVAKEQKAKIDESGNSFDQLKSEYDEKSGAAERFRSAYEDAAQSYRNHLSEYNSRVTRWNDGENRTESESQYLQNRKRELEDEQGGVEKARIELKGRIDELTALGETINGLAKKFNLEVDKFNGSFVEQREFEKGIYDGKSINIYEFEKEADLRIALVHEFGHALGLEHLDNPRAIMYRKLAAQDLDEIHLTSDDLNLLLAKLRE